MCLLTVRGIRTGRIVGHGSQLFHAVLTKCLYWHYIKVVPKTGLRQGLFGEDLET